MMERALLSRRARARAHQPESDRRRRRRVARTASSSGRGSTRAPASRMPKCTRWRRPGRARAARRSTARSSRAATRGAPARASAAIVDAGHRARRRGGRGSESRRARPRVRVSCASHGVAVEVGLCAETAIALNQPFFTLMREGRPFVILKAATSLDGRIAAGAGRADASDVGGGESPRPRRARRNRRDRRRRRDDSHRRSRC